MNFRQWLEQYTREELERMPTEKLDKMAYGFTDDEVVYLNPKQITIAYDTDLAFAKEDMKHFCHHSSLSCIEWAERVDLQDPVEVDLERGKYILRDGHHRYLAAEILEKPLPAIITIKDNPIDVILRRQK